MSCDFHLQLQYALVTDTLSKACDIASRHDRWRHVGILAHNELTLPPYHNKHLLHEVPKNEAII